ncbi:hypothetical protein [Saccharothrix xinjiangensis]|uniref:Uncharacterized protein n=1 Tax=Saccharothrix xinjiangensis TaxID=204798 RepID=A0ABV9XWT5_9PSEU
MTTTLDAEIDALVNEAKSTLDPADWQNLDAARRAIAADPMIGIQALLNVMSPAPVVPTMTAAQQDRLRRAQAEATAAGSTLTHRVTDSGHLLLTDTYQDETVTGVVDRDGNITL